MTYNRREFVKTGAMASAALGVTWNPILDLNRPVAGMFPDDDEAEIRSLAGVALDSAKSAGASYADVRFTRTRVVVTRMSGMKVGMPIHANVIQVGVRVLVDGVWGFAAVATRSKDEVAALATMASKQARSNSWANKPRVDLAAAPKVENGKWTMPFQRDPLDVPAEETLAIIRAAHEYVDKHKEIARVSTRMDFAREDRVFANSEGTFTWQRVYSSLGGASHCFIEALTGDKADSKVVNGWFIWPRGAGWEVVPQLNLTERVTKLVTDMNELIKAPPVEVGMYEVVLDGEAMTHLINATWGTHTQIDRALGFEANATGTSFVAPPEDALGKMKLGNEKLNVKCNRMHPLSPANVQWDQEGVAPDEFYVIEKGILVDYQTTREQVAWMKDYYTATNKPMKSHGCAEAVDAGNIQLQAQPNVILEPGSGNDSLDSLLSGIEKGVLFKGGLAWGDQQGVTGQAGNLGLSYEVRKGKITRMVRDAALYYQTNDMFKKLVTVGGPSTVDFRGGGSLKGQPTQIGLNRGASAPACRFKDGRVSSTGRKQV
jgi:TldD protein